MLCLINLPCLFLRQHKTAILLAHPLLIELAYARLGYLIDEDNGVGQPPWSKPFTQIIDHFIRFDAPAPIGFRYDAGNRSFNPPRMSDRNDGGLLNLR